MDGLRHAFSLESPHGPLTAEDRQLLTRLASWVVKRRLRLPAVLFLHSAKPLNYVGSQAMVFFRRFADVIFNPDEYDRVAQILERREGIDALIDAIETAGVDGATGEAAE